MIELAESAIRSENMLKEESRRRYQAFKAYEVSSPFDFIEEHEVDLAEFIRTQPFKCPAIEKKEMTASMAPTPGKGRKYSFKVNKADEIFDWLYTSGKIKLREHHQLPSPEEMKERTYCKWHNANNHHTNDCAYFRNLLQDKIEKQEIFFGDQSSMKIDGNPFPKT